MRQLAIGQEERRALKLLHGAVRLFPLQSQHASIDEQSISTRQVQGAALGAVEIRLGGFEFPRIGTKVSQYQVRPGEIRPGAGAEAQ